MSKLQFYMSPHMTKDNQFYLLSLEDGSGEAGFENKIIETIVKDAETDHILDNERPKDRKYVVEDLIEQKKVCFFLSKRIHMNYQFLGGISRRKIS